MTHTFRTGTTHYRAANWVIHLAFSTYYLRSHCCADTTITCYGARAWTA